MERWPIVDGGHQLFRGAALEKCSLLRCGHYFCCCLEAIAVVNYIMYLLLIINKNI